MMILKSITAFVYTKEHLALNVEYHTSMSKIQTI